MRTTPLKEPAPSTVGRANGRDQRDRRPSLTVRGQTFALGAKAATWVKERTRATAPVKETMVSKLFSRKKQRFVSFSAVATDGEIFVTNDEWFCGCCRDEADRGQLTHAFSFILREGPPLHRGAATSPYDTMVLFGLHLVKN